jgi:hypothetical protein
MYDIAQAEVDHLELKVALIENKSHPPREGRRASVDNSSISLHAQTAALLQQQNRIRCLEGDYTVLKDLAEEDLVSLLEVNLHARAETERLE